MIILKYIIPELLVLTIIKEQHKLLESLIDIELDKMLVQLTLLEMKKWN